jgi:hypothetical protein
MALTGGLHLSAAREGERSSGPAELGGPAAVLGLGLVGPRGKKRKKRKRQAGLGWKEGMGEGLDLFCFFFNSFSFISFSNFYSKPFQNFQKKLLTTQSIKTHAFNMMHNHLVSLN